MRRRALRPDAQAFDEIRITTVPRYKTSEMSGDEWRISAKIEFLRKGKVCYTDSTRDVEAACHGLGAILDTATGIGDTCFAGEGGICDQEGCAAAAVVWYRLKYEYCREGHKTTPTDVVIRGFCVRHAERGDCGLEDADANYAPLEPEGDPKP